MSSGSCMTLRRSFVWSVRGIVSKPNQTSSPIHFLQCMGDDVWLGLLTIPRTLHTKLHRKVMQLPELIAYPHMIQVQVFWDNLGCAGPVPLEIRDCTKATRGEENQVSCSCGEKRGGVSLQGPHSPFFQPQEVNNCLPERFRKIPSPYDGRRLSCIRTGAEVPYALIRYLRPVSRSYPNKGGDSTVHCSPSPRKAYLSEVPAESEALGSVEPVPSGATLVVVVVTNSRPSLTTTSRSSRAVWIHSSQTCFWRGCSSCVRISSVTSSRGFTPASFISRA